MENNWLKNFDIRKEIQEVYIHRFLFVLGVSAVSVFLPIYVYDIHASIVQVMLLFMVYNGVRIFTSLPVAKLITRLGYKRTALISSPFILIFYNLMRTLNSPSAMVYFTAVLGGIGLNMYWISMNSEIAESSHDGDRDHEAGILYAVPIIASIITPYLGGLVSENFGFNMLFLLVLGVIGISYIPFFFSFEHFEGMSRDFRLMFSKKHIKDFLTFFTQGVNLSGFFELWPLYVGLVITGTTNLGAVGSVRAFGGVITSLYLGKYMGKENRMHYLATGAVVLTLSWLSMPFIETAAIAVLASLVSGLSLRAVNIPIFSGILSIAKREDKVEYFAFRELAISTGRATITGLLAIAFFLTSKTNGFRIAFGLVGVSVIGTVIFARKMHLERQ